MAVCKGIGHNSVQVPHDGILIMDILTYDGFYTVDFVRSHPDKTFIFGDNCEGYGKGGQAVIRDEPNTFGVPTKYSPDNLPTSFFREGDDQALDVVMRHLYQLDQFSDITLVMPVTKDGKPSLGLGLAKLDETAPSIYQAIVNWFSRHETETLQI